MRNNQLGSLTLQAKITCTKCGDVKGCADFYVSNQRSCKECIRASVRANREANSDYYRSYDRMRYREFEHRKEVARKSSKSVPMPDRVEKQREARAGAGREKYKARVAVGNALRAGRLQKDSNCFFCDAATALQAHHHDYTKPLDVFWLCSRCHGKLHVINGDFHKKAPAQ